MYAQYLTPLRFKMLLVALLKSQWHTCRASISPMQRA